MFAGSHAIDELTHAPWPSYLISARTVEIPPFSPEETRRLLTGPLRHSRLWKGDDPKRAFRAGVLGRGRHRAHPRGSRRLAASGAVVGGDVRGFVRPRAGGGGRGIVGAGHHQGANGGRHGAWAVAARRGEASEAEWAYINGFRRHDTQPPPEDEDVWRGLRRWLRARGEISTRVIGTLSTNP